MYKISKKTYDKWYKITIEWKYNYKPSYYTCSRSAANANPVHGELNVDSTTNHLFIYL